MNLQHFIDVFRGQKGIGTNGSDNGECMGICNRWQQDPNGWDIPGYAIQNVEMAKDYLEGHNVRPDVLEIVYDDFHNPSQLPSPGDIFVFNGNFPGSAGRGHVGVVVTANANGVDIFEQYAGATCDVRHRPWAYVKGWVHYKVAAPPPTTTTTTTTTVPPVTTTTTLPPATTTTVPLPYPFPHPVPEPTPTPEPVPTPIPDPVPTPTPIPPKKSLLQLILDFLVRIFVGKK